MAPRSMKAAVKLALDHARKLGRIQPWHEPDCLLATRIAERLDSVGTGETPRAELGKLAAELRASLRDLPLADPDESGGGGSGGGGGADGPAGPDLAGLTRSGPTLGNSSDG